MNLIFNDRSDAGLRLAKRLKHIKNEDRPIVLALPRGGVPVAAEVAKELGAPMDVMVVRKLGVPRQPELGMGGVAEGDVRILDEHIFRAVGATEDELNYVTAREKEEVQRRVRRYRSGRPLSPLAGRTVILIDDGLATGVTARAAIEAIKTHKPKKIILAVPVCAPEIRDTLKPYVEEVVCLDTPTPFHAISLFYRDFPQTTDDEVVRILDENKS